MRNFRVTFIGGPLNGMQQMMPEEQLGRPYRVLREPEFPRPGQERPREGQAVADILHYRIRQVEAEEFIGLLY